jgi:hypothetical protein
MTEPLAVALDTFDRPLEFLQERARLSYGSLARVETKVSTLFAGTIAVLGFVLSKDSTPLELLVLFLYLWPLSLLLRALGVREYSIVPDAETLASAWPYYPKKSVAAIFDATKVAVEELSESVGIKAKLFRQATSWLYSLTAFIIALRFAQATCHSFGVSIPQPYSVLLGQSARCRVPSGITRTIAGMSPFRTPIRGCIAHVAMANRS